MNILLNMTHLLSGGGQQVGVSFLKELLKKEGYGHQWFLLIVEGSVIDEEFGDISSKGFAVIAKTPLHTLKRFIFLRRNIDQLCLQSDIDLIYTQFGTPLHSQSIPSVVGCAYSNLFYPEIDFWSNWCIVERILRRIKDTYRLRSTLSADGIIFEHEHVADRALKQYQLDARSVGVVRPSVSAFINNESYSSEVQAKMENLPSGFRVLCLTGWHKNKNLDLLPEVARKLRYDYGLEHFSIVITVEPSHTFSKSMMDSAVKLGVASHFELIGSVSPMDVGFLYENTDVSLLLSVLESFSNNIIECWVKRQPLLISDAEWSRKICMDAAAYANYENLGQIAANIYRLSHDKSLSHTLVEEGEKMLKEYNTNASKIKMYIEFLERIRGLYETAR